MKNLFVLITVFFILNKTMYAQVSWADAQKNKKAALTINYYEQYPFAYKNKDGKLTGIDIDIMNEFVVWLKKNKKIKTIANYTSHASFNDFYNNTKNSTSNTFGLGSTTITEERKLEVLYTQPYLKNASLLISNGNASTLKQIETIAKETPDNVFLYIKGTSNEEMLNTIRATFYSGIKTEVAASQEEILRKIAEDKKYMGYVDILAYWAFVKNNEKVYLKINHVANSDDQMLAFIMPINTDWQLAFNEFFTSGFGFTASKKYADILEKHLGYELVKSVRIQ